MFMAFFSNAMNNSQISEIGIFDEKDARAVTVWSRLQLLLRW